MMRRTVLGFLTGFAVLASGPALVAQPAPGKKPPIAAAKLFPYLDRYLKLSPSERSLFAPAYFLKRDGVPARDVKIWLLEGTSRGQIPIDSDGRIEQLPTTAQLGSAKVQLDAPVGAKFTMSLKSSSSLRPSTEMSAAELARSVRQADVGMHKAAGLMAIAVPKLDRVIFTGGAGGQAVMSNGSTAPLPGGAAPYADLTLLAKATSVKFTRRPTFLEIDESPKPK